MTTPKSKYYVYCHINRKTNKPFYYGKGSGNRTTFKWGRPQIWIDAAKDGYDAVILFSGLTESEAYEKEKSVIKAAKLAGEPIINITDGGRGISGYKHTKETLERHSAFMLKNSHNRGTKHSPEIIAKMRAARLKNNPMWNPETIEKMRKTRTGQPAHNRMAVIDLRSGFMWDSINEAAFVYGIKPGTLSKRLRAKVNRTCFRFV